MQRLKGRNIVFGALAVLACSGDPTGNESTPTAIQSNPDVVFVTQGDSEPVVVSVLDEDGNVLQADFTASDIGGGITVRLDPTYQEVTTGNPIQRGSRFFVKGVDLAHTSFKVNALGLTKTIEVTSVPGELDAEITDSLPTLGDTVTITAPTGTFFTDSSVLTFNGAAPVVTARPKPPSASSRCRTSSGRRWSRTSGWRAILPSCSGWPRRSTSRPIRSSISAPACRPPLRCSALRSR